MKIDFPYVVICGPTASGKSSLAMSIARQYHGEIISCDSVQFYRGFDIGSAKPTVQEQNDVRHHLIDILDWHEEYDANQYAKLAREKILEIHSHGRLPIIVGGSGLFLRAFWGDTWHDNLPKDEELRAQLNLETSESLYASLRISDPQRAAQLHINDKFRIVRALELFYLTGKTFADLTYVQNNQIENKGMIIKVLPERGQIHKLIEARSHEMIRQGLIEETLNLIDRGVTIDCKPMQSIGYKQVGEYLSGHYSTEKLADMIIVATRQYAKRQYTWFNRVPATIVLSEAKNLKSLTQIGMTDLCAGRFE